MREKEESEERKARKWLSYAPRMGKMPRMTRYRK